MLGDKHYNIPDYSNNHQRQRTSSSECSEESNYSPSLYSEFDTENVFNEWESYINEEKKLFYVEFQAHILKNEKQPVNALLAAKNEASRASTRRSNKVSKLYKLVGRHKNEKTNTNSNASTSSNTENQSISSSKVTFNETFNGEIKEITITIDPSNRYKFGRRSTLCESVFGISILPFPDGHRMMVANFMPNFLVSSNDKITTIKIGDWLHSINGITIDANNLDEIILSFSEVCDVKLQFQRISEDETIERRTIFLNKILSFSMVADTIELMLNDCIKKRGANEIIFSLLYLSMEGVEEGAPEGQDVLYCYPSKSDNFLYSSRGSFFTLNSLLKNSLNGVPKITTIDYDDYKYHLSYVLHNDAVLLIGIRNDLSTIEEVSYKTNEITKYFEFINRNISENFYSENIYETSLVCKLIELSYLADTFKSSVFEKIILSPIFVPLPKEAQLRIDDALSEMEAMDYSEWNDEPFKSQREFLIFGSALYYKSFLLSSHLPASYMLDIESFMRITGIFTLIEKGNIKNMIVWHEIFPKCLKIHKLSRWFLAVVGVSRMCLAVILEYRSEQNSDLIEKIGPAPFYIEEFQDTLDHLQNGGIEVLASTWISHGRRPKISIDSNLIQQSSTPTKKYEVISILKRKNNSEENVGSCSTYSQTFSEDSEKRNDEDDDESDSDWDGFPESQKGSSGFDMSEITGTLLKEVSDIIPTKVSAGLENVLFHYVQIEISEAYLLVPTNLNDTKIIQAFRKSCLLIHTILQNTIKFRQILAEDGNKPNSNRSLVAIKEHGILIKLKNDKNEILEFWVVGRLFNSPARELYVCYRSDIPQNLVEIAFRLNLHTCG